MFPIRHFFGFEIGEGVEFFLEQMRWDGIALPLFGRCTGMGKTTVNERRNAAPGVNEPSFYAANPTLPIAGVSGSFLYLTPCYQGGSTGARKIVD